MTDFNNLIQLAKKLRAPGGCPWDQEQTMESLLKGVDEEVDEMKQAIQKKDYNNLKEELGDVLFQLVMIMNIAREEGYFTSEDVLTDIEKKLIERHTWVFGDDEAATAEEALALWRKNKEKKKNI